MLRHTFTPCAFDLLFACIAVLTSVITPWNVSDMLASPSDAPCACMQPADSSSEGDSDDSESDLHERLRELKGLAKEREKGKKLSRAEQTEKNLFSKNKGAPLLSVVEELIVQCNCTMTILSCADLCMCLRARRGVAARGLRSALLHIEQQ